MFAVGLTQVRYQLIAAVGLVRPCRPPYITYDTANSSLLSPFVIAVSATYYIKIAK